MSGMRKVRSDAILHGLPAVQRQKVDGWLFDKGLTYQAVAQACGSVFGVKVSRSSVARYYERRMREELRKKRNATVARVSAGLNEEERYEALLARMRDLAEEAAEALKERQGWRWIVEITKVLIAARRERNERIRVMVRRKQFEMKSAAACLKHDRLSRHGAKAEKLAAQERIARKYDQEWRVWKLRGCKSIFRVQPVIAGKFSFETPNDEKKNGGNEKGNRNENPPDGINSSSGPDVVITRIGHPMHEGRNKIKN